MLTSEGSVSKLALPGIDPFTYIVESADLRMCPYSYVVESDGGVNVADSINHSIQMFTSTGSVSKLALPGIDPFTNIVESADLRMCPYSSVVESNGGVNVADSINPVYKCLPQKVPYPNLHYLELIHLLILWKVQIYVCAHTVLSSNQTEESMLLILSIQYTNAYLRRFRIQTCFTWN
jgi:hypothetical protein